MIKLNHLVHARALATSGNFRRAAESLNMSQPALSRSIGKLEDYFGVLLFDRQSGGVTPTIFGEVILKRGNPILSDLGELERQVMILRDLDAGQFAVSLAPSPAGLSGSIALAELVRLYPNLRCKTNVRLWHLVIDEVFARHVDLGICELSIVDKTDNRLSIEPLPQHSVVFYCRRGHPLLSKKSLSKADIDPYSLASPILPPRAANVVPGKTEVDKDTGYLVPSIEVDNLDLARQVVERSDTISWNTPLQLEPWLKKGTVKALPFRKPWMVLDYGFIYLRQRMLSPAAKAYMQLVRDIEDDIAIRNRALMKHLFQ